MTKTRDLANLIADSKIGPTEIDTSGTYTVGGIVTSGNVDGRDVSVDGAKLDGIEASADVTDTTNVTAAGALMDSEVTNLAAVKALNQGLATTDEPSFDNTTLNAIAKDISDTAVDVFVYDTSKDSDGGAWRHRTQNTSWYNETLSTSTRGSRKEFPSVAVIVAESNQVTIYDGDDPDLPMWMVFNAGTHKLIGMATGGTPGSITCMTASQGVIAIGIGAGNARGLTTANLISERAYYYSTGTSSRGFLGNIAERNDAKDDYELPDIGPIVAIEINDIAMTVLPNAPIDVATGLPVPTIAIATGGGATIIKDDGVTVSKATTADAMHKSAWLGRNLVVTAPIYYGIYKDISVGESSSYLSNTSDANYYWADSDNGTAAFNFPRPLGNADKLVTIEPRTIVTSTTAQTVNDYDGQDGLTIHELSESDITDNTNGMNAYIASDYNTGWQIGNNKLSTLSDTDTTNLSVTNLLSGNDSSFTSGTGNWVASNATLSQVSSALRVADNGGYSNAYLAVTTVVGTSYVFEAIVSNNGSYATLSASTATPTGSAWGTYGTSRSTANGYLAFSFTATTTTTYLIMGSEGSTSTDYDSVNLLVAEKDRSVYQRGLRVYGTVTKSAVNGGADLVYYEIADGANTNFLFQPYNSNLDFGTGDFSYIFWHSCAASSSDRVWLSHGKYATSGSGLSVLQYNSGGSGDQAIFYLGAGQVAVDGVEGLGFQQWVVTRRNGVLYVYRNGNLEGSAANTNNINLSSATIQGLYLGKGNNTTTEGNAFTYGAFRLALFRASATSMSPDQIKKIYEDEKRLFNANAKATLYGSSDTVTGLAYDDITKELHVGTSAGRSTFQGLSRTANTTDAVGTVISASNGLVAEE